MRPPKLVAALATASLSAALALVGGAASAATDDGTTRPAAVGANGRLEVALVVPITVPRTVGGLLTAEQLTRYTADDGLLTGELDQVESQPGVALTLAVDPRIIASIRVLGTDAPATARAWLDRLAALPNETFPLAYADADPVLLGQAGRAETLDPQSFAFAIDQADFGAPVPTASPTPTTTPAPGDQPPLPQTPQEVLAWDWTFDDIAWPAASTVVAADLPRLAAAGYGDVLLDEANAGGTVGRVGFGGSTVRGLVADTALSAAVSDVADANDFTAAERAVAPLQSAAAAAVADSGSPIRVVALDRIADSRAFLQAAVGTLAGSGVDIVPLGTVRSSTPATASIVDQPEPADRITAVDSSLTALAAEAQFATVAVDPTSVTAPRQLDFLALIGAGWVGNENWNARVTAFLQESTTLRSSVSIVASSELRALGANPRIPVAVRNDLKVPIRVYAIARPLLGNLSIPRDSQRIEITVQASSTQRGLIATQSIANGTVPVIVRLESGTGIPIGQQSTISVDVQAGWETAGILVAAVLVLGVFGFGVTRNILRRRRERRAAVVADE